MSVVTLQQAKDHLNITVATYDTELQVFIDSAEAIIATRVGPLAPATLTERRMAINGVIALTTLPVISITTLQPVGSTGTIDPSLLYLDGDAGFLSWGTWPYSGGLVGGFNITYSAGRTAGQVPAGLLLAIKEFVRSLWDASQRGPTRRPGSRQSESAANTLPGAGYKLPFDVERLIAPYEQPGIA